MKTIAALAALGTFLIGAGAEAAQIRFRGGLTITKVSNCQFLYVGQTFTSAYRPSNIGDNGPVTSLSHLDPFSADVYELDGAFPSDLFTRVRGSGITNIAYAYTALIKITDQVPAIVDTTTEFVTLKGLIRNASNDPGVAGQKCTVAFRASYFRRHEY